MKTGLKSGRSIQEFWIDFLLEEEFGCNPAFASAFANTCGLALDEACPISVDHSVCDEFGEADLVVRFHVEESGQTAALLLENKITASFQPEQAQRYRLRGDRGVSDGLWQVYQTVLVAPDRYIQANHGFDHAVSLEILGQWVCRADLTRRSFKIARLQRAIDKKSMTGVQIVDSTMTAFRAWYREQILAFASGFVPPTPRAAYWDDNWIEWTSDRLPREWRFRHRTRSGVVDLSHPELTMDAFEQLKALLPSGSTFCRIGKSRGGISMTFDPIADFADFSAAAPMVHAVLETAAVWQQIIQKRLPTAEAPSVAP